MQLTGAVNLQIEQLRAIECRLTKLETSNTQPLVANNNLAIPRTEEELDSIKRLPDSVKDLQVFDGNPIQYVSWVHNVESILKDYEIVNTKPIYRAILKHIRQKIRGKADNALISYNIFDDEWSVIKKCLSLHYADKRDIQSLENQLITMRQDRDTVDKFYSRINHQLSLIINKIKTDEYSEDAMVALINNYRLRALDVFVRGLNSKLSHLVKVQRPDNLPEAYAACLELQNMDFRSNIANELRNDFPRPRSNYNNVQQPPPPRRPQNNFNNQNLLLNSSQPRMGPPPRPTEPKPPVPMDVDQSIRTAKVNYINRPSPVLRASNESSNIPHKAQRMFNVETGDEESEQEEQYLNHYEGNFMTGASPEPPI